jgi:hypothetical protein
LAALSAARLTPSLDLARLANFAACIGRAVPAENAGCANSAAPIDFHVRLYDLAPKARRNAGSQARR